MSDEMTAGRTSQTGRRAVLFGAGALGAGALLAGCGDDEPAATPSTAAPATSAPADGQGTPGAPTPLTPAAAVPVGGGVILADREIVVTQPEKGVYKGFSAKCTHKGCVVKDVTGGNIHCACHESLFSIKDGSVQGGPAPVPLPERPVKLEGADIVPA
ncbi:iron-sulfur protein [Pilimelia terevasa]|uniref:Cytochrome bc1 complex Rieske iron-sulfur subunit n=1 Tax=Pilimelia terevasa TaxID=53372 RepID=A0A8J3FGA0_9ACTN|nr:Rieske (2Fe-2S) protein [Pilimelia terevasa]GGK23809.1 iron-sulfur protein [Pilimelia terevasa]